MSIKTCTKKVVAVQQVSYNLGLSTLSRKEDGVTEEPYESDKPDNTSCESDPSFAPAPILRVSPQPAPGGTAQRDKGKNKGDDAGSLRKELHILEKIHIFGQLCLVAVGISAAFIYGCQLGVMSNQLAEMKSSSNQMTQLITLYGQQHDEAKRSADAAKSQADTSSNAFILSEANFRQDERAWVEIGEIRHQLALDDPKVGRAYEFQLFLKNMGRTVARDVRVRVATPSGNYAAITGRDAIKLVLGGSRTYSSTMQSARKPTVPEPQTLAPGSSASAPIAVLVAAPHGYLNSPGIEYSSILGNITYIDAFNVHHWMHFCYVIRPSGDLTHCPYGNEEDDNPETQTAPKN